jgi:hypothetical protein
MTAGSAIKNIELTEIANNAKGVRAAKALYAILLTIILTLALWTPAFADGMTISIGSAEDVTPGQEFSVPVSVEGNTGIAGATMQIGYDSRELELVGFESVDSPNLITKVDGGTVGWLSLNEYTNNGVMFNVKFRVRDDAANGSYELTIGVKDGIVKNLVNANGDAVEPTFNGSSVSITGGSDTPPPDDGGEEGDTSDGGDSNNNNSSSGNQSNATVTTVTGVGADGSQVQVLVRGEGTNREYSTDDGKTWQAVPEDGIVALADGKTLSLDGKGTADYTVKAEGEEQGAESGSGAEPEGLLGLPMMAWVGIGAGVVLLAAVIALLVLRKRKAEGEAQEQELRRAARAAERKKNADADKLAEKSSDKSADKPLASKLPDLKLANKSDDANDVDSALESLGVLDKTAKLDSAKPADGGSDAGSKPGKDASSDAGASKAGKNGSKGSGRHYKS